jgi:Fusaric acid resistance protein family
MTDVFNEPGWAHGRRTLARLSAALTNAARAAGPPLLFGLRLWASVCLALYVAFWLELENAFWAGTTAAIVCQPQLGASLRKGWYRMIGTLIGAVVIRGPVGRNHGPIYRHVGPGWAGNAGDATRSAGACPAGHHARPGHRRGERRIRPNPLPFASVADGLDGLFSAQASWRTVAMLLARLPDDEARHEADAVLRSIPQELRSAEHGVPAGWIADPIRPRRACETAVRTLATLPAGAPSLRLVADQTAKVMAGISDALNGLALLVAAPVSPVPRGRGFRLRVPDWLPSLVNAGRAFVAIGTVELFWNGRMVPSPSYLPRSGFCAICAASQRVLSPKHPAIGRAAYTLAALPDAAEPLQRRSFSRRYPRATGSSTFATSPPRLGLGADLSAALEAFAQGKSAIATTRLARLDGRLAARPDAGSEASLALQARGSILAISFPGCVRGGGSRLRGGWTGARRGVRH